jgi:hypothetical protein
MRVSVSNWYQENDEEIVVIHLTLLFPILLKWYQVSFGHCVGKPDLCCGSKDHPKRVVDQQVI